MGKTVNSIDLERLILGKMNVGNYWSRGGHIFKLLDSKLYLLSTADLDIFLEILKPAVTQMCLTNEGFDCDDFVKFFMGKVADFERELGLDCSICIGPVEGFFGWLPHPYTDFHFCIWAVTDDEKICWIEPQTMDRYAMEKSKGGIDVMFA